MMVHKDSPRRCLPVMPVVLAAFLSVLPVLGPRVACAEDEVSKRKTALPTFAEQVYEGRDEAWGQAVDMGDDRTLCYWLCALMPDAVAKEDGCLALVRLVSTPKHTAFGCNQRLHHQEEGPALPKTDRF